MKGHIKAIIIVFIILITYTILVMAYAKGKDNKTNNNDNPDNPVIDPNPPIDDSDIVYQFNIILSPKTILGYVDGIWEENPDYDYSNKRFEIYTGEEKYENMTVMYDGDWHAMNSYRDFIDWTDDFTAINSSIDYNRRNQKYVDIDSSQEEEIKSFLNSMGISYNYDNMNKHVMIEDVNRDGIKDTIYVISNLFLDDYTGYSNSFAFVFAKVLNQNVTIFEDTYQVPGAFNICNPYIDQIIDIGNDSTLVVGCSYASTGGTKHLLYNINGKNVEKILETKAN